MTLRHIGRAIMNIPGALARIESQGNTIIMKLDELKRADAAEATAVTSALAAILTLSQQHTTDLANLAAKVEGDEDVSPLVASMQARAKSLNDAVANLHAQVSTSVDAAGQADVAGSAAGAGATGADTSGTAGTGAAATDIGATGATGADSGGAASIGATGADSGGTASTAG